MYTHISFQNFFPPSPKPFPPVWPLRVADSSRLVYSRKGYIPSYMYYITFTRTWGWSIQSHMAYLYGLLSGACARKSNIRRGFMMGFFFCAVRVVRMGVALLNVWHVCIVGGIQAG